MTSAQTAPENYQGHDVSIVNPATLTPALANDICMSCHQIGDVRVLKPGKDFHSFRPGTALDDTMSILLVPPKRESPPQQDLLEHYYSMTLSKCYRASGERLTCISCHDPHVEPSSQEAPAYFHEKCLKCHNEKSCTVPLQVREQQQPADDCAGCHMKKRDVREISHSTITNHRILAHPEESFPADRFSADHSALARPDSSKCPRLERKTCPCPALTLLQAYGELLEKHPEYAGRYSAVLQELERSDANNPLVQAALGNRELQAGHYSEAVAHCSALEWRSDEDRCVHRFRRSSAETGSSNEALRSLQKATELDPFNAALRKRLDRAADPG